MSGKGLHLFGVFRPNLTRQQSNEIHSDTMSAKKVPAPVPPKVSESCKKLSFSTGAFARVVFLIKTQTAIGLGLRKASLCQKHLRQVDNFAEVGAVGTAVVVTPIRSATQGLIAVYSLQIVWLVTHSTNDRLNSLCCKCMFEVSDPWRPDLAFSGT